MHRDRNRDQPIVCESHLGLACVDQDVCARLMPRGTQAQMAFVLMRFQGNSRAVAAALNVSRWTVERHAKGRFPPPGRALRERLREMTLDALCPVRLEIAAVLATRRGRRRG